MIPRTIPLAVVGSEPMPLKRLVPISGSLLLSFQEAYPEVGATKPHVAVKKKEMREKKGATCIRIIPRVTAT